MLVPNIKKKLESLPYCIGSAMARWPYGLRPGATLTYRRRRQIAWAASASSGDLRQFAFDRVRAIAVHAYENIPFYRDLYKAHAFVPSQMSRFEDIAAIPIVTKAMLREVPIEERSAKGFARYIVNTGGSSGQPLAFYIEPSSIPHEWAHMHQIWGRLGFRQHDLKAVFGGMSGVMEPVRYDSLRHSYFVNSCTGWANVADALDSIMKRRPFRYLHGYPSAIFDFVFWLKAHDHPLLAGLRRNLCGMLLGSEMPAPEHRLHVETLLGCRSVSWYGHTERAVLAGENVGLHGEYHPFITYGFAEAVAADGQNRLVATSYYNQASPLIRYDTGDLIAPVMREGILTSFRMEAGREGEFILDKSGSKVFLTALVFGRHHNAFCKISSVQVYQSERGAADILFVPMHGVEAASVADAFDFSGVDVDFRFWRVDRACKTAMGKTPLLVSSDSWKNEACKVERPSLGHRMR